MLCATLTDRDAVLLSKLRFDLLLLDEAWQTTKPGGVRRRGGVTP